MSMKTVDLHNCGKAILKVFIIFSKHLLSLLSQYPYVPQFILLSNFLLGLPSQKRTPVQVNSTLTYWGIGMIVSMFSFPKDLLNSLRSLSVLLKKPKNCPPLLHLFLFCKIIFVNDRT